MRKIISLILIIILSLYTSLAIKASDVNTEIQQESVSLVDKGLIAFSNVTFSMSNYMSTGYVTLNMGYSTTYTANLSNVIAYFDHYNHANVASVYLQFQFDAVYTGYNQSQYQWLSSNPNWDSTTKRLSLGSTIPTSASAEIWWNVIGQSGGAPSTAPGGLRLNSITLVVVYQEAIELYTAISEWNELPEGNNLFNSYTDYRQLITGNQEQVVVATVESNNNGTHNVYVDLEENGRYVFQNLVLPSEVRNIELPLVRYFATKDYKFLQFFKTLRPNIYESDILLWNLTNGQYNEIVTGTIKGYPYVDGNGFTTYNMMYVDYAIPWAIGDIISMQISFDYRYHYINGTYGQPVSTQKTLYTDAFTYVAMPWWTKFTTIWGFAASQVQENVEWFRYNQIVDVTNSYTLTKKAAFVSFLNANADDGVIYTVNNVFPEGTTVAKVFLGQFDKLWSNAVEPSGLVILNIQYSKNGVEYSKPYPETVTPNPPPVYPNDPVGSGNNWDWLDDVWSFLGSFYIIAVAIGAYIGMRVVFFFVPKKQRFNFFLRAATVVIFFSLVYFSYSP